MLLSAVSAICFTVGSIVSWAYMRSKRKDPQRKEFEAWKKLGGTIADYGPCQQGTYQRIVSRWDELDEENKAPRNRPTIAEPGTYKVKGTPSGRLFYYRVY